MSEQKMIDVTDYCNNRCKCCNEYCDKSSREIKGVIENVKALA